MRIFLTGLVVSLSLILGILLGCIFTIMSRTVPSTVLREDRRPGISVVRIDGVTEGHLTGHVHGDVRVFLEGRMIIANGSGAFRAPAGSLLKGIATARVPVGMQFVASKRGKKYYSVTSHAAQNLAVGNRVYFKTASDAEAAGYGAGSQ